MEEHRVARVQGESLERKRKAVEREIASAAEMEKIEAAAATFRAGTSVFHTTAAWLAERDNSQKGPSAIRARVLRH